MIPTAHERLLELVNDGALVVDEVGTIRWANRAALDLIGATGELRHTPLEEWFTAEAKINELLKPYASREGRPKWVVATTKCSGSELLLSVHPRTDSGEFAVVMRPFHAAVMGFDKIISFATRDAVTQLANRDAFQERLASAIGQGSAGSVICADVDQFSTINEIYGHAEGDALLRAIARRVGAAIEDDTPLARIYGGRFAAFVTAPDQQTAGARTEAIVAALHRAVVSPFRVAGGVQPVSLSIGIASWPIDAHEAEELTAAAETAVHSVGHGSVERTRHFEPSMLAERRRFFEIEAELRLAIENNELALHYQPKVSSTDLRVVGFEALVRWPHPAKGMISPAAFVPVAEQSNLIIDLGRWVLREACRQQAEWRKAGLPVVPIAVNVSPQQLLSQSLDSLLAPLSEFGVSLDEIEIEITESAMMDRLPSATGVIEALRTSGLHISIDDFGTGHSSLGNLRRLPIDVLKIDKSFVAGIDGRADSLALIHTVIELGRTLGLISCAEGVEEYSQLEALRKEQCDRAQGFLFSQPVPAQQIEALLARSLEGLLFGSPTRSGA